ncbi:hypothetical protein SAMN05421738_112125 [Algoriella xinjiangensis]|uniref:Uncharacterized protein n=1 Tax=Algoriella xinjiangensis TaxID=684065 RepID=A0A1I4Z6Q3_9FLAO|nr:hypothetical protein [Algoriella xinjiangensis]SFN45693.1 hypothetical protein SAMN05421738_112125 [Algoriella xinjiangensis]VDH16506.1 Uncharacterised protein [Algoriella xinjiangensis]
MKIHFTLLEFSYSVLIGCCVIFIKFTDGFGFMQGDDFNYVKQLQSSGSDDDASVYCLGLITTFFFLISLFSKRKYRVLSFYLLFAYFLLPIIQMGEIDSTIINGNYVLLIIVIIILLLTLYFWGIIFLKIKKYLNQPT